MAASSSLRALILVFFLLPLLTEGITRHYKFNVSISDNATLYTFAVGNNATASSSMDNILGCAGGGEEVYAALLHQVHRHRERAIPGANAVRERGRHRARQGRQPRPLQRYHPLVSSQSPPSSSILDVTSNCHPLSSPTNPRRDHGA